MGVKARILTIRLLDKIRRHPAFARELGIWEGEEAWALDSDSLK